MSRPPIRRDPRAAAICAALVAAPLAALGTATPARAQTASDVTRLDEVVVTGSRLAGGRRLTPLALISREDIDRMGGDAARLPGLSTANSGSEFQIDQLNQPQSSGTAQFNFRNLGLGSSLVLVDGVRWTSSAVVATDGSSFVDINSLVPLIALERIEVMTDGASALYGSDAVAGVVNYVTRRGPRRPELDLRHDLGRGFGETLVQGLAGRPLGPAELVVAASHFHRSPLSSDERAFTQAETHGRAPWTAVTSYGQPGSYFRPGAGAFVPDPDCDDPRFESAFRTGPADPFCRLDYSDFFDPAPEETRTQLFADLRAPWGDMEVWAQAAGSDTRTRARQSPSLPILARSLVVPADHPDNPFGETVLFRGRLLGAEAGASVADFDYRTWRLAGGASGDHLGWRWSVTAASSRQQVRYDKPDVIGSAFQAALLGFGGPDCDPDTGAPGEGGCAYFNPFGSARLGVGTPNSDALVDSLIGSTGLRGVAGLHTVDLDAGRTLYRSDRLSLEAVFGAQWRRARFRHDWSDLVNAGELLTAGLSPDFAGAQDSRAAFAEARARLDDRLELQLALRHERQGDEAALSPRLAMSWRLTPQLTARASAGRAFRAPSVFQTRGTQAAQPSVLDRGAFVFVNTLASGGADLAPERSEHASLGLDWTPTDALTLSVDAWHVDTRDLVVKQSAQAVIDRSARDTADGLSGTEAQSRLSRGPDGTLTLIWLDFVNASRVETRGLDLAARYHRPLAAGTLSVSAHWTYIDRYALREDDAAPPLSAVGSTNLNTLARSMPRNRGRIDLGWRDASNALTMSARYTQGYRNDRAGITRSDIASQTLVDVHYVRTLGAGLDVSLGVTNLADEDPPLAQYALGYDPMVADPRGRVIRLGLHRRF
ncbi:TonB-dependent receptor plug domain-containing protein [Brevundimonas lutea]|uniref:TonB-dependent receptor plug domain-containing protein n=1 Tax=Brevundimonas lutea TaxID=2293980 RepID=UPI000F0160FB|nr:TonB-dependent receptor [Brevundimonas lutea]